MFRLWSGPLQEITEHGLVLGAGEEAWELGAQPFRQGAGEGGIGPGLQAMEDEGAEQDLGSGVPGAFLFAEPGLERLPLSLDLLQPLFDRPPRHRHTPLSVVPRLQYPDLRCARQDQAGDVFIIQPHQARPAFPWFTSLKERTYELLRNSRATKVKATMAIYHLSVKPVSRSGGRSAVAAAAYRAGVRLENERDGMVHDFTRRSGVEHAENRKDARVAREFEVALPHELTPEQRLELVRDFAQGIADRYV